MPKKIKNCFDKNLTFDKILQAHYRARKHKIYKNEIIKFEINLEVNIINLINKIKKNNYKLGKYREFVVKEPKVRVIKALPYVDRVVHQWYVEEFIKPYILPRFIKDTYACIENRGTHKAVENIQHYMQVYHKNTGDFWILKCDIKKFFYSINPSILFQILSGFIQDKKLLEFSKLLIFNATDINEIGIPIRKFYVSVLCKYISTRTR